MQVHTDCPPFFGCGSELTEDKAGLNPARQLPQSRECASSDTVLIERGYSEADSECGYSETDCRSFESDGNLELPLLPEFKKHRCKDFDSCLNVALKLSVHLHSVIADQQVLLEVQWLTRR